MKRQIKIGLVGAPGSGKTELARGVMHKINSPRKEYIHEYARDFITEFRVAPTLQDQYLITNKQFNAEASCPADILISDSPAFLGYIYAKLIADIRDQKHRLYLNELHALAMHNLASYDIIVLCESANKVPAQEVGRLTYKEDDIELIEQTMKYFVKSFRGDTFTSEPVDQVTDRIESLFEKLFPLIKYHQEANQYHGR